VKVVIALGGNALMARGQALSAASQRANVAIAAESIAAVAREHAVVVTHGNGPQIGLLALQSEAMQGTGDWPLDVLGAESAGMIGYLIEQALQNLLPDRQVVTLLTRVEVRGDDAAFRAPAKPIGPVYDKAQAEAMALRRGWTVAADGSHWRRVVASPEPLRILELPAIRLLLESGAIVVCTGGGGIPVTATGADGDGMMRGVEAVIDKDLAAALLARELAADALLLLTDVDAVYRDWGTPGAAPIGAATPEALRQLCFAAGSMGPKVEAACRFVEAGGILAAIGRMEDAPALLDARCGTVVRPRRA
jgi:carbamate kinase